MKGVLWYQGCSEAISKNCSKYLERFEQVVLALRSAIGIPELPFLTVQLNRHLDEKKISDDEAWGIVREAQRQAARKLPGVFVIPANDARLSDGLHNNAASNVIIGERLAKMALYGIYHKTDCYGAPDIAKAERVGKKSIRITFDNVEHRIMCYHVAPSALPFKVVDNVGLINIIAYHESGNTIVLELEREGAGGLVIHGAFEANPSAFIPVDMRTQLPMLSFYNVAVD